MSGNQGCSLGLDVSVSSRHAIISSWSRLKQTVARLNLVSVSNLNVLLLSWSRQKMSPRFGLEHLGLVEMYANNHASMT